MLTISFSRNVHYEDTGILSRYCVSGSLFWMSITFLLLSFIIIMIIIIMPMKGYSMIHFDCSLNNEIPLYMLFAILKRVQIILLIIPKSSETIYRPSPNSWVVLSRKNCKIYDWDSCCTYQWWNYSILKFISYSFL